MNRKRAQPGFTLLELILVMLILAIAAAIVVPSLSSFAMGRTTENAAQQIMNLAQYARTQSTSEARIYRLNFDAQGGQVWLTFANAGAFQSPGNDFGNRYSLTAGMKMTVQVTPQPNVQPVLAANVTLTDAQPTPAFGSPVWPLTNTVMQIAHTDGTYMEFQPSGRVDPTIVRLTDRRGKDIDLGCATATEPFHRITTQEMQ